MNKKLFLMGFTLLSTSMYAQSFKPSYVTSGVSSEQFHTTLRNWITNKNVNDDDNFFISRVKPKARFRNEATQVKKSITAENDKRLMMWVPWDNPDKNALPDGKFDSEVFSLWSYVDHWGNWSCPLGRVPASMLDVAHKNGVAVSSVAGIPYGGLNDNYSRMLSGLVNFSSTDAAKFFRYYGVDGLGYNSEFSGGYQVLSKLQKFHQELTAEMRKTNPIFENMWYDGTNNSGGVTFDQGLGNHNSKNFGEDGKLRASLFFNYNWNNSSLLQGSVNYAKSMNLSSLNLYAGINMQGGEPRYGERWTLLKNYPISIGLWGAHSRNMFWESRNEKGSAPEATQRTYMQRIERWFTGGTRNPVNVPVFGNSLQYNADNFNFQGMSPMMTAKSSLSWDLSTEPFISYFNLGNGKFFNWEGKRQHNREWANVGVQDYLPTWRWWFTKNFMGREANDVPVKGLDAEFTWEDAYMGGSTVRIFGSIEKEYLHLFKTNFELKAGDVITVRYKVTNGSSDLKLVLSAKGEETTEINSDLRTSTDLADGDTWVEKTFHVDANLANKTLAMVALKFENAKDLDLYLGEFSIVRSVAQKPVKPTIKKSSILAYNASGVDAKLIFDMPNDKPAGEPCYNIDVNTSLFKLYAQQDNNEKVLMGVTTSWAALMYQIPVDVTKENSKIRFGVSAVSLDMKSESDIAWTEEQTLPTYTYNDDITLDKPVIKPGEAFNLSYVDPRHEEGTWSILNEQGNTVYTKTGKKVSVEGLQNTGVYTLQVEGKVNGVSQVRQFPGYVQITETSVGALPEIKTLTANEGTEAVTVKVNDKVNMAYTGRDADGALSRGLNIAEKGVGFKTNAAGFSGENLKKAWTLTFWIKFNTIANGGTQILDLRDQDHAGWPQNNWGSFWSTYDPANRELAFTIRHTKGGGTEHQTWWRVHFIPQTWTHVAVAMESNNDGIKEVIYVNGKRAEALRYKNGSTTGTGENPTYQSPSAYWSEYDSSFMLIGKGRHQTAAIDGVVDDVKFFDRTLTEEEVKRTMTTKDASDNPYAYWNFEKDANASNVFPSETNNTNVEFCAVTSVKGSAEGKETLVAGAPAYAAGCFFSAGTAFELKTTPTWRTSKGTITDVTGTSTAGSAKVSYPNAGEYTVTLTLENSYGKSTKTFNVIRVESTETGINDANVNEVKAYTVGQDILVECPETGNYNFEVYSIDGTRIVAQPLHVEAGNVATLHIANTGVYILKVVKDGKTLKTAKLLRK